ncbi:hypothetical protein EV210_109204 [Anaerospora hongkongensis]|uniref:Uncharacterized protein n=1 Tax=Anaerospora hongkongensis TaxID=244830 RepID=A0A4R1PY91_9FIRM|nr:hypothetical protein [Anaerospora hongkongensis]TCL36254.1 hypothetical protein EV210_109204 [Anaerospora hongkongensis]
MDDIFEIGESNKKLGIITRKNTHGEEFELVKRFIDYRKEIFKPTSTKKLAIFIEPKINLSYPDIVFVEYNPNNFEQWNKSRFELGSADLKILYHIYVSHGIDATNIVTQLGCSWKDVILTVEKLYDSDLIIRKNQKWCIKNKKSLSVRKIEAVEAKINKWDEVFQQAIINKNFASESYALSKLVINPQKNTIDRFDNFGIGLYIQNNDGFKMMREAQKTSIPVSFNSIYFNEWIGRAISLSGKAV